MISTAPPLRLIIRTWVDGWVIGRGNKNWLEDLECGHRQQATGRPAESRRCRKCAEGRPKDFRPPNREWVR